MIPVCVAVVTSALLTCSALAPHTAEAQSLLDRPDNISGDWVGSNNVFYFNFIHRFTSSGAPERKVANTPTFLIATGVASRFLVGANYATNSPFVARYPNEWEFFTRYAPVQQEDGRPFDLGGEIAYNLSFRGIDGELSVARRQGPFWGVLVTRTISDTIDGDQRRFAFGGGGTFRLNRFIAIAGDAASLTDRRPDERIAWSAGVHFALPNTPHTLSINMSNAVTATLQGESRGGRRNRYGFEFTIPIHWKRFFTPEPAAAAQDTTTRVDTSAAPPAVTDTAAAPKPAVSNPAPRTDTTRANAAPARTNPAAAAPRPAAPQQQQPQQQKPPQQQQAQQPQQQRAAPKNVSARIKGSAFVPSTIQVDAGSTVSWKNLDALVHTVTAADKSFNSGNIAADGSYSHTFSKPGSYAFICTLHPFMKGTVVVK
jgi:plastocyanin